MNPHRPDKPAADAHEGQPTPAPASSRAPSACDVARDMSDTFDAELNEAWLTEDELEVMLDDDLDESSVQVVMPAVEDDPRQPLVADAGVFCADVLAQWQRSARRRRVWPGVIGAMAATLIVTITLYHTWLPGSVGNLPGDDASEVTSLEKPSPITLLVSDLQRLGDKPGRLTESLSQLAQLGGPALALVDTTDVMHTDLNAEPAFNLGFTRVPTWAWPSERYHDDP